MTKRPRHRRHGSFICARIPFEGAFAIILLAALALAFVGGRWLPAEIRPVAQPAVVGAVLLGGFLWRPSVGLLAFAIFVLVYDTTAFYVGDTIKRVDEMVIPPLLILGAFRLSPWRTQRVHLLREGALLILVALGVLSSIAQGVPVTLWVPALALLLKPIVVLYVATWLPVDRGTIVSAARVVLSIGAVLAVLAIVEAFGQSAFQNVLGLPEWVRPRGSLPSVKSLFAHPAIFAWFAAFLGLYCFVGFVELRRPWLLALAVLFGAATFLTARRRAIAAAALALMATFAWSVRRLDRLPQEFLRWVPVFLAGTALVVVFLPGLLGLYGQTVEQYVAPPSPTASGQAVALPADDEVSYTAPRAALYGASVSIARDFFPLGGGVGRFGSHMSRVEYSPLYQQYGLDRIFGLRENDPRYVTDTFWPMILGEFGVGGLLAYAAFLATVIAAVWGQGRMEDEPIRKAMATGTLAVLAAAVVESLATPMFTSPPRSYLLFTAVGAVLALGHWHRGPMDEDRPRAG